jgi:predicted dehydrogenase
MNQVKVGVVGVGRMGERHCRIFSNMRKTHLVGVCDIDKQTGHQVSQKYEVPYYENFEELIAQVDAVSIATPTQEHFEQAMYSLNNNVHVLIEKPITETLEQGEIISKLSEQKGLIVLIGHIERFNPAYIELKNVIENLDPLAINFQRLSPYKGSNIDVDVIQDLMIHDTNLVFDLICFPPKEVHALGFSAFSGTIDHAVAQLLFENGPILTMSVSRVTEQKIRRIEVTCREAFIECDLLNKSLMIHHHTMGEYINHGQRGVKYHQESVVERISVPSFEPLFLELEHFVSCIINDTRPLVSAYDGYEALNLTNLIREDVSRKMLNLDRRRQPRTEGFHSPSKYESALAS